MTAVYSELNVGVAAFSETDSKCADALIRRERLRGCVQYAILVPVVVYSVLVLSISPHCMIYT